MATRTSKKPAAVYRKQAGYIYIDSSFEERAFTATVDISAFEKGEKVYPTNIPEMGYHLNTTDKDKCKALAVPQVVVYTRACSVKYQNSGYSAVFVEDGKVVFALYGPMSKTLIARDPATVEVVAAEKAMDAAKTLGYTHILIKHTAAEINAYDENSGKRGLPSEISDFHQSVYDNKETLGISFELAAEDDPMLAVADEYASKGVVASATVMERLQVISQEKPRAHKQKALPEAKSNAETKRSIYICPACGKRIAKTSTECKYCGEVFTEENKPIAK